MRILFIIFMLLSVSACANKIYGVTEEQWGKLTASERNQAIEHHQQKEVLREKRRVEFAKIAAEKEKQKRLKMEHRQARVKEIYAGKVGVQGDLLRVTIRGGKFYFNGKHRHYRPVSFSIADGERKIITFHHPKKHYYLIKVPIEYYDGTLSFDFDPNVPYGYDYRHDIIYEPEWRKGKYYNHITLHEYSNSRARDIGISVEAVKMPRRY